MATNVFKRKPLGRIPYGSTNFLDPDRTKKNQPGELPLESDRRGKEPKKYIDRSHKTVGVQMLASNRYAAIAITRRIKGIATSISKPFKILEDNPVLQMFINGPSTLVNQAISSMEAKKIVLHYFDITGPGNVRGPNIYRDRSVMRKK